MVSEQRLCGGLTMSAVNSVPPRFRRATIRKSSRATTLLRERWIDDVDTRRLFSFVRIVDAGSITRAADILHIAQPALSQQMTALEAQFGQQLLIRHKQ